MSNFDTELSIYRSALRIDRWMPRGVRRTLVKVLWIIALCIFIAICVLYGIHASVNNTFSFGQLFATAPLYSGIFFVFLPLPILFSCLSFFCDSFYFRGLTAVMHEDLSDKGGITLEVAHVFDTIPSDLTRSFVESKYGTHLMLRLGVSIQNIDEFAQAPRSLLTYAQMPFNEHDFTTFATIADFIFTQDTVYREFLFKHQVTEDLYRGATDWINRDIISIKHRARWWGRDILGKVRGLGQEFSFGIAYSLKRYIRPIQARGLFSHETRDIAYAAEILNKMEMTLARNKSANVLFLSESGMGDMEIIAALGEKIAEGESVASIVGKHIVLFDDDAFIATHNTKEAFEYSFLKLMSESDQAGNIILVIENIADFIKNAESLDIDIDDLLGRFLESESIQFIVTSDSSRYHHDLEMRTEFLTHFEAIRMETADFGNIIRVLEESLLAEEYDHKIFFTFPSVHHIAEVADRYLVEGVMPDKALSFLAEVAARASTEGVTVVTPDFIDGIVREKTGIGVGAITEDERVLLTHLEEKLHERVIGQDNAVKAIARAMRRARTGIQDAGRPIGSFLFLGSTGVGKTETAKALAHVFFGSEDHMTRFDMSEYSGDEALERLIGDGGGALSSLLQERPYGVLLLDEFEKSSPKVRDLFLQILDEGVFTSMRGKKINARNSIIIATSNAGSSLIWEMTTAGRAVDGAKDQIIDSIIQDHIMKPELINRFDEVVIFESLNEFAQEKIARIMLLDLEKRIKAQGYRLSTDDSLVSLLMKEGYDPQFGARPMRRAIQDIVEEKIASRILEQSLKKGDTITLTAQDFVDSPTLPA